MALVDDPHGRFQGGQVAQAEEVHLQQAGLLDVAHVPLGADDLVLVAPADDLKRNQRLERLVGDHHARGVRAGVPRRALEPLGEPDQPLDLGVLLDHRPQGRLFLEGLLERDVQPGRDQLVDLLDPRQRNVQHPAHVLDRRLGLHRAEGADLGHVGVAVLLPDVLDDLVAPLLAEVDVDVGRLGAIGVEEPLEQEVVLDRADVAQVQDVADQGAAGRPARRGRDAALASVADEVPDDQEIRGEAHALDDAQLVVQPLPGRGRRWIAVALAQASLAELLQVLFRTFLLGRLKRGELPLAQAKAAVVLLDSLGDPRRHRQRLIHAGKDSVHLLGTADVELVGELAVVGHEPRLVQRLVDRLARVDAEQDVVGQVVVLGQVVGVAGGHHRESEPSGHVELALHAVALDLQAVVLDLDEEVPLAEGLVVPHGQVLGLGPCGRSAAVARTRSRRSPTGRSAPRCAVRGSPCRSWACSNSPRGTTATRAAAGCESRRRSAPARSGDRHTARLPPRPSWSSDRFACRARRRLRSPRSG